MKNKDRSSGSPAVVNSTIDTTPVDVLTQKRFSTRTRFEFGPDDFAYRLDTDGSSRTYRLEYADLSADRETLLERNSWWRNVGLIWILLGVVSALMTYAESQSIRSPIWLWLGLVCYAVYHFKVMRYQIIPSERCNVIIIDDVIGQKILHELETRRAQQLRQRFDYITVDEHPEQQRNRIQWLAKQGALDANEVSARLLQLDAMASAHVLAAERKAQDDE